MPCAFKYETKFKKFKCQFDEPEDVLIQLEDGTQWCQYHCPMTIKIDDQTIETEKSIELP